MTPAELKSWRAHWRLSQSELARRLGVNLRTVAHWEGGTSPMPGYLELALEGLNGRLAAELHERARGPLATSNAARSAS